MTDIITRNLFEDLVYWGNPVNDGYGGYTFDTPIQIKGRWEDYTEIITDKKGEQKVSKAKVYVDRTLDENGYLIRGLLSTYLVSDPVSCGAEQIIKFEEIPNLRNSLVLLRARM